MLISLTGPMVTGLRFIAWETLDGGLRDRAPFRVQSQDHSQANLEELQLLVQLPAWIGFYHRHCSHDVTNTGSQDYLPISV